MSAVESTGFTAPASPAPGASPTRQVWTHAEARALYDSPFNDLLFRAQTVHRQSFDPNRVQLSRLLSIKTGGCPEDCGYCSQSAHYQAGVKSSKLMDVATVVAEAKKARDAGATRYCMGAAWRKPSARDMQTVAAMVEGVKALGMETCMTLGMLGPDEAQQLKTAGLDYYNHNIDTSERYYEEIISTRCFADRLDTLTHVRDAGIKVCCGGIVGMGEQPADRIDMLVTLANLPEPPESVPVNMLIPIEGTPLGHVQQIEPIEFVRTIAAARIMMPTSMVRLSAGRTQMSDEMQALCFFAGANSIFIGDTLLTADNPGEDKDAALFQRLGLAPMALEASAPESGSDAQTHAHPQTHSHSQAHGHVHAHAHPHADMRADHETTADRDDDGDRSGSNDGGAAPRGQAALADPAHAPQPRISGRIVPLVAIGETGAHPREQ